MREDLANKREEFRFDVFLLLLGHRARAVLEQENLVSLVVSGSSGAFHANVCQEAGKGHIFYAVHSEDEVNIARVKRIECSLSFNDDVLISWFQFVDDLSSPCALSKCLCLCGILMDWSKYSRTASISIVLLKEYRAQDRKAIAPSFPDAVRGIFNRSLLFQLFLYGLVKAASWLAEIVLKFDKDYCGLFCLR